MRRRFRGWLFAVSTGALLSCLAASPARADRPVTSKSDVRPAAKMAPARWQPDATLWFGSKEAAPVNKTDMADKAEHAGARESALRTSATSSKLGK